MKHLRFFDVQPAANASGALRGKTHKKPDAPLRHPVTKCEMAKGYRHNIHVFLYANTLQLPSQ